MVYFKIGKTDYSSYVNKLKVSTKKVYSSKTTAAGNSVVDYKNTKRVIDVGFIPLNDDVMAELQTSIDAFVMNIHYLDPKTNILEVIECMIPTSNVEYYTIQDGKVMYKAFTLTFTEL